MPIVDLGWCTQGKGLWLYKSVAGAMFFKVASHYDEVFRVIYPIVNPKP